MPDYSQFAYNPCQPLNPTDEERHILFKAALSRSGRLDDYGFIIKNMSPPSDITAIAMPGSFNGKRVAIIGGGLAGLSAGFELRKLGFEITIFDAQTDHIGGRIYTWYFDSQKTLYGEFGAMRMPVSHETLWHYVNLFRLSTRPFIQTNANAFIYLKGVRVRNDPDGRNVMTEIYPQYRLTDRERRTPWQQLYSYGYDYPLREASPASRSEILEVKPHYFPYTLFWDGIDNRRMLEGRNLSQGAINLLKNFAPLAGENLYNSYIDYAQEVYSADLSYLYEIPGGMSTLPLAFCYSLSMPAAYPGIPAGLAGSVDWRIGCGVDGIYLDEGRQVVLAYRKDGSPDRITEKYDYAVCAIPFSTLRTIDIQPRFSSLKMQAIREVFYINAEKTVMLCKQRFWEKGDDGQRILGGASYTDLPIAQIYYPSDHVTPCTDKPGAKQPPRDQKPHYRDRSNEPGVFYASYNYSQNAVRLANMEPALQFEEIKRQVEAVHGLPSGTLDSLVTGFKLLNWDGQPWFRGALCFYTPQQKKLFSMASAAPEYDGRLFFAGEHISAKHRWMQGALQSGMEAANALAASCVMRAI